MKTFLVLLASLMVIVSVVIMENLGNEKRLIVSKLWENKNFTTTNSVIYWFYIVLYSLGNRLFLLMILV